MLPLMPSLEAQCWHDSSNRCSGGESNRHRMLPALASVCRQPRWSEREETSLPLSARASLQEEERAWLHLDEERWISPAS